MARAVSDEELQLRKRARRRLIGAIALVTLVAVFLPMVLDSEPKQVAQDIAITIPAKDQAGAFSSRVIPRQETPAQPAAQASSGLPAAPAPVAAEPAKPASSGSTGTPGVPRAVPPTPGERPQPGVEPKPEPRAAASPAPEPRPAAAGGFVVQLGAFSNPANVKQLQERLSANGIKSYTEVLKSGKGDKTRVRAGPFATREAAEKANDKLKKMGLNGIVAPR